MTKPALFIGLALIAAGAAVHGATTHRWAAFAPAAGRADKLHATVVRLGDYQSEEVPNEIALKERSVGTSRRYTSAGRDVNAVVSVTTGPPGAVSTHTPEVCYPSSGYRTLKGPTRREIALPGGGSASYYVAEFEKRTATRLERQRVRWAWTTDGTWTAPDRPRFAYLRSPELAKLYIVTALPEADADAGTEDTPAVRQFVAEAFAQYAGPFAGR